MTPTAYCAMLRPSVGDVASGAGLSASGAFCVFREEKGWRSGGVEEQGDVERGGPPRGAREVQDRGHRVDAALVQRSRGASEELRDHAPTSSRARSTTGWASTARRSPASTRSRSPTWSRSPIPETFVVMPWRSGESKVGRMICDVVTPDGQPYEGDPRYVLRSALDRMHEHGLRHVQRRARARVLPVQGRNGHGDARRGRLLRDDDAGRRDRAAQRDDPGAREGRDPDRVPPPRGRARRSTRSTCASRRRSRWPTTRSPTG